MTRVCKAWKERAPDWGEGCSLPPCSRRSRAAGWRRRHPGPHKAKGSMRWEQPPLHGEPARPLQQGAGAWSPQALRSTQPPESCGRGRIRPHRLRGAGKCKKRPCPKWGTHWESAPGVLHLPPTQPLTALCTSNSGVGEMEKRNGGAYGRGGFGTEPRVRPRLQIFCLHLLAARPLQCSCFCSGGTGGLGRKGSPAHIPQLTAAAAKAGVHRAEPFGGMRTREALCLAAWGNAFDHGLHVRGVEARWKSQTENTRTGRRMTRMRKMPLIQNQKEVRFKRASC